MQEMQERNTPLKHNVLIIYNYRTFLNNSLIERYKECSVYVILSSNNMKEKDI